MPHGVRRAPERMPHAIQYRCISRKSPSQPLFCKSLPGCRYNVIKFDAKLGVVAGLGTMVVRSSVCWLPVAGRRCRVEEGMWRREFIWWVGLLLVLKS